MFKVVRKFSFHTAAGAIMGMIFVAGSIAAEDAPILQDYAETDLLYPAQTNYQIVFRSTQKGLFDWLKITCRRRELSAHFNPLPEEIWQNYLVPRGGVGVLVRALNEKQPSKKRVSRTDYTLGGYDIPLRLWHGAGVVVGPERGEPEDVSVFEVNDEKRELLEGAIRECGYGLDLDYLLAFGHLAPSWEELSVELTLKGKSEIHREAQSIQDCWSTASFANEPEHGGALKEMLDEIRAMQASGMYSTVKYSYRPVQLANADFVDKIFTEVDSSMKLMAHCFIEAYDLPDSLHQ